MAAVRFDLGADGFLYVGEVTSTGAGDFTVQFFHDDTVCLIPNINEAWVCNVPGTKADYEAAKALATAGHEDEAREARPAKRARGSKQ